MGAVLPPSHVEISNLALEQARYASTSPLPTKYLRQLYNCFRSDAHKTQTERGRQEVTLGVLARRLRSSTVPVSRPAATSMAQRMPLTPNFLPLSSTFFAALQVKISPSAGGCRLLRGCTTVRRSTIFLLSLSTLSCNAAGAGIRDVGHRIRSTFDRMIWCGIAFSRKMARSCASDALTP